MTINEIIDKINEPASEITRAEVEQWQREHPYFVLPAFIYLKRHGVDGNEDLAQRLAIMVPSRRDLAMHIEGFAKRFINFYPSEPEPETPDTDTTIDQFLASYGNASPKEIEALNASIFNPMPDYADVLAAQEQETSPTAPQSEQDRMINDFIEKSRQNERQVTAEAIEPEISEQEKAEIASAEIESPTERDSSMISESLAKFYISQHKYESALEIIRNISLNFPEKSIYFADQIRFLRKLIVNEQYLNKKQ